MRKFILLITGILITSKLVAQNGQVTGKVIDSQGKALPLVTVTVFNALDTSIVTYKMTNYEGNFKIGNLPLNKELRLLVTYSGYEAVRKQFNLNNGKLEFNFDSLKMVATSKNLDEVIVVSERPPVLIKNDTIEFNANAFKTLPNALVEDLLRKLPGVRVDSDGNITVNGKSVNKILVDGKSFFGDDPKMATRNLPANAIDKVQVVDDKDQAMLNGDYNTNSVGKVINITLKKGVKKGYFGKIYGGGGTKERYEVGGIANIFRDTLQISVLGYSNNLNRSGFSYSDLMNAGGLRRSNSNQNSNSTSIWSNKNGSNISVNGVNFGGGTGYGLTKSTGAGININHSPDKKKSFFFQYFFGQVDTKKDVYNNLKQLNNDTIQTNNTTTNSHVKNFGHSFGTGFTLKPDMFTTVRFNANYIIGLEKDVLLNNVTTDNNFIGSLSEGNYMQRNRINNYNYKQSFYWLKQSKKIKQRSLVITNQFSLSKNKQENQTNGRYLYYYPTKYDSLQNQLRFIALPQTNATIGVIFKNPLSKSFSFKLNARYKYDYVRNEINTNNALSEFDAYNIFNSYLSGEFNRNANEVSIAQTLNYKKGKLIIAPYLEEYLLFSNVNINSNSTIVKQNIHKLLPGMEINYGNLNLSYEKKYSLPSYTYLLPIVNNYDPYSITNGNPYLKPILSNEYNINYNVADQKSNIDLFLYGYMSFKDNDIIQKTIVDEQGVVSTVPINARGSKAYFFNFNLDKDFKFGKNNSFKLSSGGSYSIDRSRLYYNTDSSIQTTYSYYSWVGFHLNLNDKFEWDNSYNPGVNFTRYATKSQFSNINVITQNMVSNFVVHWQKHVILENNIDYTYNSSLSNGAKKNLVVWTAAINFTFLHGDYGVLRIKVYDIMDQNKRYINLHTSGNRISLTRGTMLPRYLMATFTYNIHSIGQRKIKTSENSLLSM